MALTTDKKISGTFSGTGPSDYFLVEGWARAQADVGSGTTVVIKESLDASLWIASKLPDGSTDNAFTADFAVPLFFPVQTYVKLECTVYGASTPYDLRKG